MNSRFSLIALSIVIAVLSLALFITVVGATASSISGEVSGIPSNADIREGTEDRLLAYQGSNISQDEPLSLTEPISIYLPLLEDDFVKYPLERAALLALYNSTTGNEWENNTGWGTDSSHCDWYGVTCDEDEHVTSLDLGGNGLTGTLLSEIGNLPLLTVLRLNGTEECIKIICWLSHRLSGPLPAEIGNLVNLQELDLDNNQFTSLPPEIGNLASLWLIDLSNNHLTSLLTSLPPEIGNLVHLQELDLNGNQLSYLPPEVGNLVHLQELELYGNQLTFLPSQIGNLTRLQVLILGGNKLASLPPEIGNLASLQMLSLGDNQLASLPLEIGNLMNLQELYLHSNQLTTLPLEIGNLASLKELVLWGNLLEGPIPAFLSDLGNLFYLDLSSNHSLTCWETEEARDWVLSLLYYDGPTCFVP